MTLSRSARAYGFALLTYVLFSSHDAIVKVLVADISVFQIIFYESLFGLIPLIIMMLMDKNTGNFRPRHPWLMAIRTGLNLIALSSVFYAFGQLPLAEAYALIFATPLLITALSVPILGEKVGVFRWVAVVVGLVGVLVVLRPGVQALSLGHLAALTSAIASALSVIILRKVGNVERSAVMIIIPTLAGIVVMAFILPWVYVPVSLPTLGALAIAGALIVSAQLTMIGAYRAASSAAAIAPVQYTQILWATLFGVLFFDEIPDGWLAVGAAIIIGSGLFVAWRESRASKA